MNITDKEWKNWVEHYKICYYPYFLYSLPQYNIESFDKWMIQDEINKHLAKIKTLLLYFDYVTIPISTLLKPRNKFAKLLFEGLIQNKEFIDLYEKHLVISTLYKGEEVHQTFEKRIEYLKQIGWITPSNIYEKVLKYELSSFLLYEITVQQQVDIVQQETKAKVDNLQNRKLKNEISKLISEAEKNSHFPFSHEKFSSLIFKKQDKDLNEFLTSTNITYFEASEIGNPGAVMPFIEESDRINRKSFNTGAYSILYSADFFMNFLKYYIDFDRLLNIAKLNASDLSAFRRLSFWREFITFYHSQIIDFSKQLEQIPSDNIMKKAEELIKTTILPKRYNVMLDALLGIINKFIPLGYFNKHNTFKDNLDTARTWAYLQYSNKHIYDYLKYLNEVLSSKVESTSANK